MGSTRGGAAGLKSLSGDAAGEAVGSSSEVAAVIFNEEGVLQKVAFFPVSQLLYTHCTSYVARHFGQASTRLAVATNSNKSSRGRRVRGLTGAWRYIQKHTEQRAEILGRKLRHVNSNNT